METARVEKSSRTEHSEPSGGFAGRDLWLAIVPFSPTRIARRLGLHGPTRLGASASSRLVTHRRATNSLRPATPLWRRVDLSAFCWPCWQESGALNLLDSLERGSQLNPGGCELHSVNKRRSTRGSSLSPLPL